MKTVNELSEGIDSLGMPVDLQGWNSNAPVFAELIEKVKPSVIVEVGTWKGCSAINMARLTDGTAKIYCVDTWLGGIDHLIHETPMPHLWGYPQLFYQFLVNVRACKVGDDIYPIPQPSVNGAKYLTHLGIKADLIYIDASHEEEDVMADIIAYSQVLKRGGVMFGDDYGCTHLPGVKAAVDAYAKSGRATGIFKLDLRDTGHWILSPP